jgi:hypothetical protein
VLAYVFWHWPRPGVDAKEYEDRQRRFHAALVADPPRGFASSFSVAVERAPWGNESHATYEDWYLVHDFAALGELNDAAVSGSRTSSHDAAASVAAGGTAGLYRLRLGGLTTRPAHAAWFAKPSGLTYAQLFDSLAPIVAEARATLWLRQLTFGPAPELCLQSASRLALPAPLAPTNVLLRSVWSPG